MKTDRILESFKEKVCNKISLRSEGLDKYRVLTPFKFEDGDHFKIVLKKVNNDFLLTDEGHTFMHLSYYMDENDFQSGTREKIIKNAISLEHITNNDGELLVKIPDEKFGDALFSFLQGLTKISNITYLSRDVVRTTFEEDLKSYIYEQIRAEHIERKWHHPILDKTKKYVIDYRINGIERPLFIFGLDKKSDTKVRDATICIHQFEKWKLNFEVIGVFEEQETIGRKVLSQFTDVCKNQYSNLYSNKDRIRQNIREILPASYLVEASE